MSTTIVSTDSTPEPEQQAETTIAEAAASQAVTAALEMADSSARTESSLLEVRQTLSEFRSSIEAQHLALAERLDRIEAGTQVAAAASVVAAEAAVESVEAEETEAEVEAEPVETEAPPSEPEPQPKKHGMLRRLFLGL